MRKISYAGYRFPPEIIQQAIWLYLRFTLSLRDVEDLLAERGVTVSYETVRRWVNHFGPMVAADLRKRRPKPHSIWRLDEVYLKIDGCMVYLWRAVDAEGEVPDGLSCAQLGRSADGRCTSEADVEATGRLGCCGWIVLKNSNFSVDHDSGGRRRAWREFREPFRRAAGLAACGARTRLAVTMTRVGDVRRLKSRFLQSLIFRVFQQSVESCRSRARRRWPAAFAARSDIFHRQAIRAIQVGVRLLPTCPDCGRKSNLQEHADRPAWRQFQPLFNS